MKPRSFKKGFTLIELLVVIAIIAILAAILFPVLAEARRSGKATVSINNTKQQTLAILLYAGDHEDRFVPTAQLGDPDSPFSLINTGLYKPWSWLIYPYGKSDMIFMDALTQREGYRTCSSGLTQSMDEEARVYCPQFGYAFSVLSPVRFDNGAYRRFPVEVSEVAESADTVMLVMKAHRNGGRRKDWVLSGTGIWMSNLAQPPVCTSAGTNTAFPLYNSVCTTLQRWGLGGMPDPDVQPASEEEGNRTAANALRNRMKSITAFADGHVKVIPAEVLAAGTNWDRNRAASQVVLTDRSRYIWDIQ